MNKLKKLIILILLILVIQLKRTDYNTKINETEKKTADHNIDKNVTTQEFNKLTAENFTARLTQANLGSKNYIADLVKKISNKSRIKGRSK